MNIDLELDVRFCKRNLLIKDLTMIPIFNNSGDLLVSLIKDEHFDGYETKYITCIKYSKQSQHDEKIAFHFKTKEGRDEFYNIIESYIIIYAEIDDLRINFTDKVIYFKDIKDFQFFNETSDSVKEHLIIYLANNTSYTEFNIDREHSDKLMEALTTFVRIKNTLVSLQNCKDHYDFMFNLTVIIRHHILGRLFKKEPKNTIDKETKNQIDTSERDPWNEQL